MGVSTNIYTIFGIRHEWSEQISRFHEYDYDPAYDDPDTPWVLIDGMGGEYAVLGELLYDSGDFRWGMEGGSGNKEIDLADLPALEAAYKAAFVKKFPEFADLVEQPFKLITMAHFH